MLDSRAARLRASSSAEGEEGADAEPGERDTACHGAADGDGMGVSLTMIDRHYGHLARDGREHAIRRLDDLNAPAVDARGRSVDTKNGTRRRIRQRNTALSRQSPKSSNGLEPLTPSLP
jgi:hypothetical protein